METKIEFVTITLYEYNKLKSDIDEMKKLLEIYKNDKDFICLQMKHNNEITVYFRESASYWRNMQKNK
jgi:hypothetical protein